MLCNFFLVMLGDSITMMHTYLRRITRDSVLQINASRFQGLFASFCSWTSALKHTTAACANQASAHSATQLIIIDSGNYDSKPMPAAITPLTGLRLQATTAQASHEQRSGKQHKRAQRRHRSQRAGAAP